MTKQIDPKILDRIRKLLNTANGTSFEGEATTAMRMAQEYMTRHGVSMDDVALAEELKEEIVKEEITEADNFRSRNPEHWAYTMAMAVAEVFDCKAYRECYYDYSRVTFAGYKSDVRMAKLVFVCLYIVIRAAAVKHIPQAGRPRLSFMLGVAVRLVERAKEEKQVAQQEPTGRFALVVRSKEANVADWLASRTKLRTAKERRSSIDPNAYDAGRKEGDRMDLMNREKVRSQPTALLGRS